MIILTYALVFFSLFATACSDNNNETYVEPILSQIEVSKLVTENNKTGTGTKLCTNSNFMEYGRA